MGEARVTGSRVFKRPYLFGEAVELAVGLVELMRERVFGLFGRGA